MVKIILTSTTCGVACWHAHEDICRCSCGGKNHGILKNGGEQPERTCKINGKVYKLVAVGEWLDIRKQASELMTQAREANVDGWFTSVVDKTPSGSQLKWSEVVNSGIARPQLLWKRVD
jgi:hypothetical protein